MSLWLVTFLEPHLDKLNNQLKNDEELQEAFSGAAGENVQDVTFALVAATDAPFLEHAILVSLDKSTSSFNVSVKTGTTRQNNTFALNAKQDHWEKFFQTPETLRRPYQSFWGMLRILGPDQVFVTGDNSSFAKYARVWRTILDRIRLIVTTGNSQVTTSLPEGEESEEDAITGKYLWITHSKYGKVKLSYEFSGTGPQSLLFLHTAGSDSRQHHTLMNNPQLQNMCTMYALDLPGHGRSSLGTAQSIDTYTLTESSYIESISLFLTKLRSNRSTPLQNLIVSGASMAGQISLALSLPQYAKPLHIRGSIPCEGCAHIPQPAAIYNSITGTSPSILDPEKVCGMISPTSPTYYYRQIWNQYSSQAYGVFPGDLKFYFVGWDGRDRLKDVDTGWCPVYMLTGEFDYSCTVEMSRGTSEMIGLGEGEGGEGLGGGGGGGGGAGEKKGKRNVMFEEMKGLGHFPLTENPERMLPYLVRAIEYIQENRRDE